VKFPNIRAFGTGIGLFLSVYIPAFVVTGLLRPRVEVAVPLIIAITLLIALILVFVFAQTPAGAAEFGFAIPNGRYLAMATLAGLILGIVVTFVCHRFPSKPPLDLSHLRPWMTALYFIIGAPIQEEVIFRGLIQSMLERRWTSNFWAPRGTTADSLAPPERGEGRGEGNLARKQVASSPRLRGRSRFGAAKARPSPPFWEEREKVAGVPGVRNFSVLGLSLSRAVVFTAVLFGIIHLEVGAVVAIGAIILGLVAGELRRRSGSLLPAIIVHALFNAADAYWPKM
jgi:membrane protease YdiL (CAAX protease family)